MTMSITELERSLRALRLSGMTATLQNRALQVAQQRMDFIEAFSALVLDELDRRRSRLIDRRFSLSGLPERKDLKDFDWQFNPKIPKRQILELAALQFIDEREDALFIGSSGVGKSHAAKALARLAVQRGYTVFYREAHVLIDDIHQARKLGEIRKYRATLKAADLVVIDDLFLRKLPPNAGDEFADVIMSRYENDHVVRSVTIRKNSAGLRGPHHSELGESPATSPHRASSPASHRRTPARRADPKACSASDPPPRAPRRSPSK